MGPPVGRGGDGGPGSSVVVGAGAVGVCPGPCSDVPSGGLVWRDGGVVVGVIVEVLDGTAVVAGVERVGVAAVVDVRDRGEVATGCDGRDVETGSVDGAGAVGTSVGDGATCAGGASVDVVTGGWTRGTSDGPGSVLPGVVVEEAREEAPPSVLEDSVDPTPAEVGGTSAVSRVGDSSLMTATVTTAAAARPTTARPAVTKVEPARPPDPATAVDPVLAGPPATDAAAVPAVVAAVTHRAVSKGRSSARCARVSRSRASSSSSSKVTGHHPSS